MTHEPEIAIKTVLKFDPPSVKTLRRSTCSCGWRGPWYESPQIAEQSFQRHAVKVGPLPVSA